MVNDITLSAKPKLAVREPASDGKLWRKIKCHLPTYWAAVTLRLKT
ncbi:MAG: hypothetical protein K2Q30_14000 [Gemmataceae bacterium]|nr:hypothetical protein [Gemmataceae bacterium]